MILKQDVRWKLDEKRFIVHTIVQLITERENGKILRWAFEFVLLEKLHKYSAEKFKIIFFG